MKLRNCLGNIIDERFKAKFKIDEIITAKKVLKLSMEGLTIYEIAKLCEITEENVKEILE